jgi:5'-nucleotidase
VRQRLYVRLSNDFDIFIATTPPWSRPEVWGHKREWLEEHFPWLEKKLILTHRKDLLIGDILIDDTRWRGQPDFQGTWLWFGTAKRCLDWPSTLELIYSNHR